MPCLKSILSPEDTRQALQPDRNVLTILLQVKQLRRPTLESRQRLHWPDLPTRSIARPHAPASLGERQPRLTLSLPSAAVAFVMSGL